MRPKPLPALNIIAIQEMVGDWGRSSSRPRGIRPDLPAASQMTKSTNAEASSTNSQPRLPVIQVRAEPLAVPSPVGLTKPQATKPSAMTAATANRTLSTAACRSATQAGGSAMAGWGTASDTSVAWTVGCSDAPSAGPFGDVRPASTAWLRWRESEPGLLGCCSMTLPFLLRHSRRTSDEGTRGPGWRQEAPVIAYTAETQYGSGSRWVTA